MNGTLSNPYWDIYILHPSQTIMIFINLHFIHESESELDIWAKLSRKDNKNLRSYSTFGTLILNLIQILIQYLIYNYIYTLYINCSKGNFVIDK